MEFAITLIFSCCQAISTGPLHAWAALASAVSSPLLKPRLIPHRSAEREA